MDKEGLFAGRYQMLRRLGQGGMGDVWLAEQSGPRGFRRHTVIKRVRSHLTDNDTFVRSFEAEARLAAILQHPNIARVEDFGEVNGTLFLVIEYVDGHTLRELALRAEGLGQGMPVPLIVHTIAQVARGLHYAHQVSDLDGAPLNIVHRDVTPHNIMVTRDGQAKLLDFGVASSATNQEPSNLLKGKLPYLSPEQAHLQPLDGRSDLFSLAIILWELLARQRLFLPGSRVEIIRRVRAAKIPAVPPRPDCPDALRAFVHRALSFNPDARFPTGGEFADELEQISRTESWRPTVDECNQWVKQLLTGKPTPLPIRTEEASSKATDAQRAAPALSAIPEDADTLFEARTQVTVVQHHESQNFTASIDRSQNNLPRHLTRFIGRTQEVEKIHALFQQEVRLLSLLGPGGMGKSRLAVHYASQFLSTYDGGAWFIDLTSAHDFQGILAATCKVLNIPILDNDKGNSVERLGHAIAGRGECLLIFDNFEHVAEHAATCFSLWLRLAPDARFLTTTQQVLGMRAETTLELHPPSVDMCYELFMACAGKLTPGYGVDEEQEQAIHQIIERLDGLPLALELAAAKTSILSPVQILARLDERFRLLRSKNQDWSERQRTLFNAIDWSWSLLRPWEREALTQCSVFQGGFFLEDAEEVVDLSDFPEAPMVVEVLEELRNRSLLRTWVLPELRSQVRFGLYESIHAFVTAKRLERDDRDELNQRHGVQMLATCERLLEETMGPNALESTTRLGLELDNLYVIAERENRQLAVKAAASAARVMIRRGPYENLVEYAELAISEGGPLGMWDEVTAALLILCRTALQRGALDEGAGYANQGMEIALEQGSDQMTSQFQRILGDYCLRLGKFDEAREYLTDGLERARRVGSLEAELENLYALAIAETLSLKLEAAERYVNQYMAVSRHHGVVFAEAKAQAVMSWVLLRQGRYAEAEQSYWDALEHSEKYNDLYVANAVATNLGGLLAQRGKYKEATEVLHRSLEYSRLLGRQNWSGFARVNLAIVSMRQRKLNEANTLLRETKETGDPHLSAWLCALRSLLQGLNGEVDEARDLHERAVKHCDKCGDPLALSLARTCKHGVDVHLAKEALSRSDLETARKHAQNIQDAINFATNPVTAAGHKDERSPAEQDGDIRTAVEIMEEELTRIRETIESRVSSVV